MSDQERKPSEERPGPVPSRSTTHRPFQMERAVPDRRLWETRRQPIRPEPEPKKES